MAYYDDRRHSSHHDRYSRPPHSQGQDPYHYGGGGYNGAQQQMDVVRRHDANDRSYEGYSRDYIPRESDYEYGYGYPPQSRRSELAQEGVRRSHSMGGYYDDPNYNSSSRRRTKRHDDRRDRYDHSPPSSRSPSRRRRKSLSEQALSALGLGLGSKSQDSRRGRSHSKNHRSYSYSPSPSRGSRSHGDKNEQRIAQAVRSALTAGAVEAFRVRKDPGDWTGEKGKRVLTAALTAGGTDGLVDRDPRKHSKRHIAESALAGLAANRLVNGPRSKSQSKSRGRSHGGSVAKDAAITGILAAAGKEAYDRFRSRSRPRHRSNSRDSSRSYSPPPRRAKKRSKSVTDYITEGIDALGFNDKDDRHRHRHRRSSRYGSDSDESRYSDYHSRRRESPRRDRHSRDVSRLYYNDNNNYGSPPYRDEGYGHGRFSSAPSFHDHDPRRTPNRQRNDSDAGNSTDEERKNKKMAREMLVTTGLAAVATIHAAHSIHGSLEKHKKRAEMLKEGEITPEEARRRRHNAQLRDAANLGMAALGIQSALSEWKHVEEKIHERNSFQRESKQRQQEKRQRAQSMGHHRSRVMYPDEIEENFSTPEKRSRSGRSPSVF